MNDHFWRNFWPVLHSLGLQQGVLQGVVNGEFDLCQICLTVQWPAAQSTSKNCMLYIRLQYTYYDIYRGLELYLPAQVGSQTFVFKEW